MGASRLSFGTNADLSRFARSSVRRAKAARRCTWPTSSSALDHRAGRTRSGGMRHAPSSPPISRRPDLQHHSSRVCSTSVRRVPRSSPSPETRGSGDEIQASPASTDSASRGRRARMSSTSRVSSPSGWPSQSWDAMHHRSRHWVLRSMPSSTAASWRPGHRPRCSGASSFA